MRLLRYVIGGEFSLEEFNDEYVPPYAILSHTWGADDEEVTFKDLMRGTVKYKAGYKKIKFCEQQAVTDGLQYFWVDTCCIDKTSSAELSEAINSMFRWYKDAAQCYVYLTDVSCENAQFLQSTWETQFRRSRWFTRGWTLQELIAPASVTFFSREGKRLGDKKSLERQIHEITGIGVQAFQGINPLSHYNIDERMSWAESRQTKRSEDKAYSLMGIFDVFMPPIYGEGERAFLRLQETIAKSSKVRPVALSAPISTVPFPRDPEFVDCISMLDQINRKCAVPGSLTALVGLGGIGKSQLAIEYSYRIRERSPETWVFWVHASNADRFEQSYRQIANELMIPGRMDAKSNVLKLVRDRLQNETKDKWILVLDNIDNADFLFDTPSATQAIQEGVVDISNPQPIINYLPRSENGSILITTRDRRSALRLAVAGDIIEIKPMDKEGAFKLLQNKLPVLDDNEAIAELVAVLDFLPLAIVQAAAYISQRFPRYSVRQYLEEFRESDRKKTSLMSYERGYYRRDTEVANSVFNTWQISFNYIRMARPSAAALLSLMSFFDRQGIPEVLIQTRTKKIHDRKWSDGIDSDEDKASSINNEDFELDILTLLEHFLISTSVDGTLFEMHALVQLAMRNWLEAQGELESWKRKYIEKLSEEFPTGEYENWEKCMSILPHVKAAMNQQPEVDESLRQWATLLYNVAWYAWRRGMLADAENMSVRSMEVRKNLLGLEHADTLKSMAMVGLVYKINGQWTDAEELETQVMETRKRVLGAQHPDTLTSMGNLASTYRNQGRWERAEELQAQVIATSKIVLGEEHPDTLTSMTNLASTYMNQGRWKEAEELEAQAMDTFKRLLGEEHPDTLISTANLASTYMSQGRWKEAEELQVQVMETSKRVLGPEHPDTLASIASLASTFRNQGRWKEAEELESKVMETRLKVLGPEHPDTLTGMANLASTFWNQGRWVEAEELDLQVMERSKNVLGIEHPSTLTSMANLASTYTNQSRWNEAEALGLEVVEISRRVLGAEHPSTLASMANLASTFRKQGRWNEAEALEVQVMETRKAMLGAEHPATLTSTANLASTYRNQGRWKEAEELEIHVMETRLRALGANHPSTLTSMANLSLTWKEQNRNADALTLLSECVRLRIEVLGFDHPDTLSSAAALARWQTEKH